VAGLRRKAEAADRPAGEREAKGLEADGAAGPAPDLAPARTARGPANEPVLKLGPLAGEDSLRRHETRPEVARAGGEGEALKESYRPAEAPPASLPPPAPASPPPPAPDDLPPPTPARPQPLKALGEKAADPTSGARTALAKAGQPEFNGKDGLAPAAKFARRSGPHDEAAQTTDALQSAEAGFLSWANGTIQTVAPLPPDQVLLVIRVRAPEAPTVTAESAVRAAEEAAPAKQAPQPAGR
jgi:hypothetical protein